MSNNLLKIWQFREEKRKYYIFVALSYNIYQNVASYKLNALAGYVHIQFLPCEIH